MARPRSITEGQILNAARGVFLEKGPKATTAEIAARAKVSEGSIFKRFPTKAALFQAAMGSGLEAPMWMQALPQAQDMGLEEGLLFVGHAALEFFIEMVPRMSMVMASLPKEHQQLPTFSCDGLPVRGIKLLTALIEEWQRQGKAREGDASVAARIMIGSLFHFAFSEMSGINRWLPMSREDFVSGLVKTLTQGLERR
jgi:AcrR family transcriptional regulator